MNSSVLSATPQQTSAPLRRLGSLKLTLAGIGLLIAATTVIYQQEEPDSRWLVAPLALLAFNLLCAILTTPKFRAQTTLLAFHVALLAMVVLAALGRLTALSGSVELADGVPFAGVLDRERRSPLHFGRLDRLQIVSEGFTVNYRPGPRRDDTHSRVRWVDEGGRLRSDTIGDQKALRVAGYRFYTTFNKGFAPVFEWTPGGGEPLLAAVHLPAYPAEEFNQARSWSPPGAARELWFLLDIEERLLDAQAPSALRVPERYRLTLRYEDAQRGDARHVLRPGDRVVLPEGELHFVGLRGWMGYKVFYDWTMHWLLAAGTLAVVSLGVHFWRKYAARPWDA